MAARIGIEIGPVACRIIDLDAGTAPSATDERTLVRSFGAYVRPGRDLRDRLKELHGRSAAVVAWGLEADHAQLIVPSAPYERMRALALTQRRRAITGAARRRVADIAPAAPADVDASTRPVVLVSAPAAAVAAALRPLAAAGIRVRSVTTPAAALMSLARRRVAGGDATGVYVALAETTTAIAVVRNGALVSAEETPWGYLDPDRGLILRRKGEVAAYLASRLETCVTAVRPQHGETAKVYLCGGMSELRTVALSLIECLDVEVDAWDSLFGIDINRLPEDGLDLRDRPASLRVAWIAAVESPAPLDLLREGRQRRQRAWLSRAAVFAGMAAGLGLGYLLEPAVRPVPVLAFAPRAGRRPPTPPTPPLRTQAAAGRDFVRSFEPSRDTVFAAGLAESAAQNGPTAPASPGRITAELQTILYGPDRKLAVIDGRVLQTGDEVAGGRLVSISDSTVIVRDQLGRETQLHIGKVRK